MGRTQIYLGDEERAILDRVAEATGASRSELIRRAIRNTFADRMTKADRVRVVEATAGAWRNRPQSGAESVDAIRGDLNERLRKLGLA